MAKSQKHLDLDSVINHGIDIHNRRIYFGNILSSSGPDSNDVSPLSVELAVRGIHTMSLINHKPIIIFMNSYGGDPQAMLYLMDVILTSPCPFHFVGGGAIMSSATWIMAVCDNRILYPNATLMIHNGKSQFDGTHDDHIIDIEEDQRQMEMLIDIFADHSFMPREFWEDIGKRDLYLSAEEAKTLGLVDEVVQYDKRKKKKGNQEKIDLLVEKLYDRIKISTKYKKGKK